MGTGKIVRQTDEGIRRFLIHVIIAYDQSEIFAVLEITSLKLK